MNIYSEYFYRIIVLSFMLFTGTAVAVASAVVGLSTAAVVRGGGDERRRSSVLVYGGR